MDQKKLHQVEKQCIQEEAPACQSACPLHVDARTFVDQIKKEKFSDAWKTLTRSLPFPGILARICDHPCEKSCLREKLGGPISIGALERFCVNQPRPRIRTIPMPKKKFTMAVVGENLSSLVAALELLKKGYEVTLFTACARLGGTLWDLPDTLLPDKVMDQELATLYTLGLKVEKKTIDGDALADLLNEFSAVYLGLDTPETAPLVEEELPAERTFALKRKGLFAGGFNAPGQNLQSGNISTNVPPMTQAFQGRAAALSMERFTQKVSLTEGRENEGAYPTRLYTNIEDISPLPPIEPGDPGKGYTKDEARAEAERCIQCQCLECVKICPYLAHFKGYPKRYAREIYNNATIVLGDHAANLMINSCSLCGLCTEICPENFPMADLCLDARRDMVENKKMPPSAHAFALDDMAFSNSDSFILWEHAPDRAKSDFAFFPGCQLAGSNPDQVIQTYQFLLANQSHDTGLMLQCCAAPAHWAGNEPKTGEAVSLIERNWQDMGRPIMILACSSCMEMFKLYLPQIEVLSLWEVMDKVGQFDQTDMPGKGRSDSRRPVAIHDPCTTRNQPQIQAAARSIAAKLSIPVKELELSGKKTECCGFGGLMENANPDMAKKQLAQRVGESELDYLVYCAMCREQIRGAGKRTVHLLDFIFPPKTLTPAASAPDHFIPDPAGRPKTGLSQSRENREELKRNLLEHLWHRSEPKTHETVLHISPEVNAKLEKRRILHRDIRAAISHGESRGRKMQSVKNGRFLVAHRPSLVTFWVEYSPADTGYHIHNSYCHRMQVIERKGTGENS